MFKLNDRIKESSMSEGILSYIVLNDTYGGFQSFKDGIGDGNTTYYTIENNSDFEVGVGTYIESTNSISRDKVLVSSNNNQRIELVGVSVVFCSYPASHAFFLNEDGYASGLSPYYSGIAFPDGRVQTQSFSGSGAKGEIAFWEDNNVLHSHRYLYWDDPTSTLLVSGVSKFYSDVYISGNFEVAGTQTVVNTNIINSQIDQTTLTNTIFRIDDAAGCFFHAYVDNEEDNTVALYSTNENRPTWKLGLKNYSLSFVGPPVRGYIYGDRDSIGGVADGVNNSYVLNASNGFWIRHLGSDIFNVQRQGGVSIYNESSVATPLNVRGASNQAVNLQEWTNYSDDILASVSNQGQIKCSGIEFPDGTIQLTAASNSRLDYISTSVDITVSINDDIVFVDCSSQDVRIKLPIANGNGGKSLTVKRKIGSYKLRIISDTGETIDGKTEIYLNNNYQSLTFVSDNTNWYIV